MTCSFLDVGFTSQRTRETYSQTGIGEPTLRRLSHVDLIQVPSFTSTVAGRRGEAWLWGCEVPSRLIRRWCNNSSGTSRNSGLTSPLSVQREFPFATIKPELTTPSKAFMLLFVGGSKFHIQTYYAFLGHLQNTTIDSQSDISRVTSGLSIRRAKKHMLTRRTTNASRRACRDSITVCRPTRDSIFYVPSATPSAQIRWLPTASRTRTKMTTTRRMKMIAHRRRLLKTPVRHRPCQLPQSLTRERSVSWHSVTHASHSCPAFLWVLRPRSPWTKPWLSCLSHGHRNGVASVLTIYLFTSWQ